MSIAPAPMCPFSGEVCYLKDEYKDENTTCAAALYTPEHKICPASSIAVSLRTIAESIARESKIDLNKTVLRPIVYGPKTTFWPMKQHGRTRRWSR